MMVGELFRTSDDVTIEGDARLEVTGLCYDSRLLRPGDLFFAISGEKADGHEFIDSAVEKKASAVVLSRACKVPRGVTVIRTADVRRAMGTAASSFYRHPSRAMTVVGVTGTNGKTTTSYILESIWRAANLSTGVVGTISYRYGRMELPAVHTTPESVDLQGMLAQMREAGVTHGVLEVSSHALAMERIGGLQLDGAVFTNLSHDHLDFHKNIEEYFHHKSRLFSEHLAQSPKGNRFSVINEDDQRSAALLSVAHGRVVTYGTTPSSTVHPKTWRGDLRGIQGVLSFGGECVAFSSSLVGVTNLYNLMAAGAAAWASGVSFQHIRTGIEELKNVPGRMERIDNAADLTVFVDYAHTPDALEKAIQALRPLASGRVLTIVGCGGNRDRHKRPVMGRIAAHLSDLAVLTSDNPRSEDPAAILNEVEEGARTDGAPVFSAPAEIASRSRGYIRLQSRAEAIAAAILHARSGDTILIAGKGHENYQIVGTERSPFDDREEARKALQERARRGPM